jgi:hypothetical protein
MKIKLTLIVDREPIDIAPSGDLADAIKSCEEDASYIAWILQAPVIKIDIEAVA